MNPLGLGCLIATAITVPLGCSTAGPSGASSREPSAQVEQPLRDAGESQQANVVDVLVDLHGARRSCTGIVIEPQLVVTAQHCLAAGQSSDVAIDCASALLPGIESAAQAWVVSEDSQDAGTSRYDAVRRVRIAAGANRLCGEDIALLELAEPLPGAEPLPLTGEVPPGGSEFLAIGNGTDVGLAAMQRQNRHANLVCVGEECNDVRIASSEFLAHAGACEGDSGSPAIDGHGRAFGMAVRSSADCSETAYLQFKPHLGWLASSVLELAAAENRTPPSWANEAPNNGNPNDSGIVVEDGPNERVTGTSMAGGCGCSLPKPNADHGAHLILGLLLIGAVRRRRSTNARGGAAASAERNVK